MCATYGLLAGAFFSSFLSVFEDSLPDDSVFDDSVFDDSVLDFWVFEELEVSVL